jgi:hypothetical protein
MYTQANTGEDPSRANLWRRSGVIIVNIERTVGISLEQNVHIGHIEECQHSMYLPACCDEGVRARFEDFHIDSDRVVLSHCFCAISPALQGSPFTGITM